jgi:hypothetical protein
VTKPRFLMPGGGQGPERLGYSHEPLRRLQPDTAETKDRIAAATDLRDEPEAPSQAWVDAEAELAAQRDLERRRHEVALAQVIRQNLSLEHRIADCQRRAKDQHRNISMALHLIDKQRIRGRDDNALVRVAALEAVLDGLEPST